MLTFGNKDPCPDIQIGSTNGYNIGASKPTASLFSSSASIGDMVVRTTEKTRLLLQYGISFMYYYCELPLNRKWKNHVKNLFGILKY